jgi:hypothetical protein
MKVSTIPGSRHLAAPAGHDQKGVPEQLRPVRDAYKIDTIITLP